MSIKYECAPCGFVSSVKCNGIKHFLTQKHLDKIASIEVTDVKVEQSVEVESHFKQSKITDFFKKVEIELV